MPRQADETLIRNLRWIREQAGYSQDDAAIMADVKVDNLRRYERGDIATVPSATLRALARVYGCSMEDFYKEAPPQPRPEAGDPVLLRARPGVDLTEAVLERMQRAVNQIAEEEGVTSGKK